MHSYLKAIGYSDIITQGDMENLIMDSLSHADEKNESKITDNTINIEYIRYVSERVGVIIRGEQDLTGKFHFSHIAPFLRGIVESCKGEEIYINKKIEADAFTGMCDDVRLGVSMIFYIQNVADYYKFASTSKQNSMGTVHLAALAREGKVLLGTQNRVLSKVLNDKNDEAKHKLIEEARNGDQDAIQTLTLNDIDKYAIISERIKNEDVFSIVETSFVPFGSESDVYSVLCHILAARQQFNTETGEKIWIMDCVCNNVRLEICINAADLIGMPMPGMRFRGTIWLQGRIEFQ